MDLQPIDQTDERLRQACPEVTRAQLRTKSQQVEIGALLDYFYGRAELRRHGRAEEMTPTPTTVGLSANQVGVMKQICIVDLAIGRPGYHDVRLLINPHITWSSSTMVRRVEGCVNFDEWWGITKRPQRVKISAIDRSGFGQTLDVSGWAAAVVCHEIDHLKGRLFIDRLEDPRKAHLVSDSDYPHYRKRRAQAWEPQIDVSKFVVPGD